MLFSWFFIWVYYLKKNTLLTSKKKVSAYAVALAAVLAMLLATPSDEPTTSPSSFSLAGTLVRVADGDTLTIRLSNGKTQRVRLASIDAPEMYKSPQQPGQEFAQHSARRLSDLVDASSVNLRCYEYDHYERAICDVLLPDGQTANQILVEQGLAWANQEKKGRFLHDKQMLTLEDQARTNKRGLWSSPKPIAPWKWRYDCWQKSAC